MIATTNNSFTGDKIPAKRTKTVLKAPSRRVARTCHDPACNKNPYFGWHGQKALYCVTHKEPEMVDVKNKRCEADGCMKRGLFGYDGERARFCGGHRLEGMVDLKNKRCKWVGCAKQANFAAEGKSTACFCGEHKSPGMVDVKGRRCEVTHCTKVAGFGLLDHQPTACAMHRGPGMVDMKQRVRLGGGKAGGINVKIGGAGPGGEGGPTSYTSKWGRRYRKSALGGSAGIAGRGCSDGPAPAVALSLDSHADFLRPPRRETVPSLQHWYSDSGFVPCLSGQAGDQSTRSRGLLGSLDGGVRRGILGSGMWTHSKHADVSSTSRAGGGSGGHQTPSQWPQSRASGDDTGSFSFSYPSSVGSGLLPGMQARDGRFASGNLPFGSSSSGTHIGGMGSKTGVDGWRLGVAGESHTPRDGSQQTLTSSAMLSGVDHHGYGALSSLASEVCSAQMGDGQGRGMNGGGGGGGQDSGNGVTMAKADNGNNLEITAPDVESEDIWLRDLMQGAMPRENSSSQHPSGPLDVPSSSSGDCMAPGINGGVSRSMGTTSSGTHYPRHLGLAPPPMSHTMGGRMGNSVLREDRRPFLHHAHQHQRQQPQQPQQLRYHRQVKGGNSPKMSRLPRVPYADAPPMVVRSPSTASNGATPPHDSVTTDAIPRGQLGNHDSVGGGVSSSAGGGGGVSGIGDGTFSRGGVGVRGSGPASLNHLFMTLPSVSGCDGHVGSSFNSDMQFLPSPRVGSPGWGGV